MSVICSTCGTRMPSNMDAEMVQDWASYHSSGKCLPTGLSYFISGPGKGTKYESAPGPSPDCKHVWNNDELCSKCGKESQFREGLGFHFTNSAPEPEACEPFARSSGDGGSHELLHGTSPSEDCECGHPVHTERCKQRIVAGDLECDCECWGSAEICKKCKHSRSNHTSIICIETFGCTCTEFEPEYRPPQASKPDEKCGYCNNTRTITLTQRFPGTHWKAENTVVSCPHCKPADAPTEKVSPVGHKGEMMTWNNWWDWIRQDPYDGRQCNACGDWTGRSKLVPYDTAKWIAHHYSRKCMTTLPNGMTDTREVMERVVGKITA